ncbi:MAG: hypothetical protein ACK4UN_06475 [Limisphaerales bacterium]
MNPINHILVILAAYLAVYMQATFDVFRDLFGVQLDLLPTLIVYASLTHGILFVGLLAFWSGLFYDSLSANPLGISVLPLFFVGLMIYFFRTLLLRERTYAQFVLGTAACAAVPVFTLMGLFTLNQNPLFGVGTLWQILLMAGIGGVLTPVIFRVLDRISRTFNYAPLPESSFRPDREIKRGRGQR